ncbi:MAG: CHAT domain-containing tetratricopeptide repeat protein, partial [Saprospiraceae bacterium]
MQFLFATYYAMNSDFSKIDSCVNLCIQITERIYTRAHPKFNELVFRIANLYFEIEKYNVAENLLLISRKNYNQDLAKNEYDLAKLNVLQATIYSKNNLNKEGIHLLEIAKSIIEKTIGKKSSEYLQTLHDLAFNFEKSGNYKSAEKSWNEYFKIKNNLLLEGTNYLSSDELEHYTIKYAKEIDELNSFIYHRVQQGVEYDKLLILSYNANLIYKRLLLNSSNRLYNLFAVPESVLRIKKEIDNYQKKLAQLYSNNTSKKEEIKYIEDQVRTREKLLVRYLSEYSDDNLVVDWKEVKSALKTGEIAIEFLHFPVTFPSKKDSIIYAAILLKYGDNKPTFIPLFEEKELDFIVSNKGEYKSEYVHRLYDRSECGVTPTEKNQRSIYDIIWHKIDSSGLENLTKVYYSPSGVLHRINLSAIKYERRSFLDEKYQFVSLGSMKQLIPSKKEKIYTNRDAILIGGVDYNLDTSKYVTANIAYQIIDTFKIVESQYSPMNEIIATRSTNEEWDSLEGTAEEIKNISQHLKNNQYTVTSLSGLAASEERFKAIGIKETSPRILHISTHGFFFDKNSSLKNSIANDLQPVFKISDNPLWRSGLILAGANYAWQNKVPFRNFEDGILTAYEIAQMNLSNTELVVLSACESGLGEIKGSEGVYGLQRAFKIAGVKYILMSLWSIPDESTQQLMTLFYNFWMEKGMPIHIALKTAQQEM